MAGDNMKKRIWSKIYWK